MSRRFSLFGAAALGLLAACSDSTTTRTVAHVNVAPATRTLTVGEQVTLSASAVDVNGSAVEGRDVSWSSSSPAVASVTATGVVTALDAGAVVTRATVDGRFGEAALVVRPVPIARVVVDPAALTVGVGRTATLTARAFDAAGNELRDRTVT